MNRRRLNVALTPGQGFEELVDRFRELLGGEWFVRSDEGRRIASAETHDGQWALIDGRDDLGSFLSDDHVVLEITLASESSFSPSFEDSVRRLLRTAGVTWERGVWSRLSRGEAVRELRP